MIVSLFFSHMLDDFNVTLGGTNITYDRTFVTCDGSIFFYSHQIVHMRWFHFFLLTSDSSNFTLGSNNITYDRTIVTFSGSLFFSCHIGWFQCM